MTEVVLTREEELARDGWTKQSTNDEPRLSELAAMYESLGYEVHLEPLAEDTSGETCQSCFLADADRYQTIYTRPKQGATVEDDLW